MFVFNSKNRFLEQTDVLMAYLFNAFTYWFTLYKLALNL